LGDRRLVDDACSVGRDDAWRLDSLGAVGEPEVEVVERGTPDGDAYVALFR
jgi:hypothetical protein